MKKLVPNAITLLNLFSGCMGIVYALTSDLRLASLMIFISLVLDYLDGTAARLLNVRSPIGKELDSLADVVSFGVLPSMIAFKLLNSGTLYNWSYLAFLMAVFSAYRLAKFNLDERQTENFIGLPTPANALFWSSFPLVIFGEHSNSIESSMAQWMNSPTIIILCIFFFSYILISELSMFSLKFKNFSWKDNSWRFIFLLFVLILISTLGYLSIPFILLLYILISIIQSKTSTT